MMKLRGNGLLVLLVAVLVGASGVFAEEKSTSAERQVTAKKVDVASERAQVARLRKKLATMSKGDHLSPLFNTVARVVKPSVVVIRVTKKVEMGGGPFMMPGLPPDIEGELRKRFGDDVLPFRRRQPGRQRRFYRQQGQGSGVIVDAENGYILTNDHVVGGADEVEVIFADGRTFKAQWIRRDKLTDLAVVKIEAKDLIACPLGNSDKAKVGHWVLAIGAPFGLAQTVTSGIVSAKGRANFRARDAFQNFIQTDAAINRGNSGGPLVNMRGEVIGINAMILSPSGAHDGVGFAIPSNMVRGIMKQLIDNGQVRRGYLGVGIQDMTQALAESLGLKKPRGGLVTQIQPGSAAAKAGLELEDIIVAVNGKAVKNVNELRNAIASHPPNATITLRVVRDGKRITIKAKLSHRPGEKGQVPDVKSKKEAKSESIENLEKLGLTVQTFDQKMAENLGYGKEDKGVLIVGVEDGSDAWKMKLRRGMLITNVGKKPVANVSELAKALQQVKGGYRLRIKTPDGGAVFVFLKPEK